MARAAKGKSGGDSVAADVETGQSGGDDAIDPREAFGGGSGGDGGAGAGADTGAGAEPKRKRGRPFGSTKSAGAGAGKPAGSSPRGDAVSLSLADAIFGLHALAATPLVNAPEFALTEAEAAQLAKAVDRLDLFHGDGAIPAWAVPYIGLAAVAGKLYVPRVMAFKARKTAEAARGVNGPAPVASGPTVQGKPVETPPPPRRGGTNGAAMPMDMETAMRAAASGNFGTPQGNA